MVSEQAHHKGNRPQRQAHSSHSLQQARRCTAHGAQWGEAHCALQEGSWLNSTRKPPPGSERLARQSSSPGQNRCARVLNVITSVHVAAMISRVVYSNSAVNSIAQKPGKMPSSQHMWEGATTWYHITISLSSSS